MRFLSFLPSTKPLTLTHSFLSFLRYDWSNTQTTKHLACCSATRHVDGAYGAWDTPETIPWPSMAMDQYLYIPFLGGWTSIYQLFWCELQGDRVLTHPQMAGNSTATAVLYGLESNKPHASVQSPGEVQAFSTVQNMALATAMFTQHETCSLW